MDPKTKATARDTNWNWKTRFWHIVFVWLLLLNEIHRTLVYIDCLYNNVNAFYCCTLSC